MMVRRVLVAAGIAGLLAGAAPALAQDPVTHAFRNFFSIEPGRNAPRSAQAFGGSACKVAVAAVGADRVWWGRFAGGRYQESGRGSHLVTTSEDGCFPSRAACEAWLYEMKSYWQAWPIHNECRPGYDPSAPVRPWWKTGRG